VTIGNYTYANQDFIDISGYTREEWKVVTESRKILHLPELRLSCTAVRIPVFVSHSEASRMSGIMDKAGALPILTVGEDDSFARNGGIINFVLKNDKVRLEIDLAAAKKAGVTISSKLLAVADAVKGKPN